MADARENRWVRDLVAVEIEDRQHRAVANRIDELVRMPRGGERPGLRLAVADDARDDEFRVVERRAVGVRQAVAELAAFVDRARRLRRDVRADVAGERELLEELLHPLLVLALVRIDLGVSAFEIGGTEHARRAVARTGHEDHVELVALDHAIEMRPHERERRARAPVAEQAMLHVLGLQGLLEQGVVLEIDHSDGEVIARAPPGIDQAQLLAREGVLRRGVRTLVLSHAGPPLNTTSAWSAGPHQAFSVPAPIPRRALTVLGNTTAFFPERLRLGSCCVAHVERGLRITLSWAAVTACTACG